MEKFLYAPSSPQPRKVRNRHYEGVNVSFQKEGKYVFGYPDVGYLALARSRARSTETRGGTETMRENDFLPDHLGVADGQLPQTLANIAEVEADRGVHCARSGNPIEISRVGARELYQADSAECPGCNRCQ